MQRLSVLAWIRVLLCGAAGIGSAGAAQAVQSSASITGFSIQVIDLDLNDGVSAGYSFANASTTLRTIAIGSAGSAGVTEARAIDGWGPTTSIVVDGTATSAFDAGPGFIRASGSTTGLLSSYDSQGRRMDDGFTIRSNTKLVFTADFDVIVDAESCTMAPCQGRHAFAGFRLFERADDGHETTAAAFALQTSTPASMHEQMVVSYATGDADWRGHLDWQVSTFGTVPIPEPQTWSLMAAGLLGILLRLKRRQPWLATVVGGHAGRMVRRA
jgi:hypothetical protein